MFEIDDTFLANIGYSLGALSADEIVQYKREITEELQARLSERLGSELDESQVEDFESIEESSVRAKQWLYEFHSDFVNARDYKTLVDLLGEDEAQIFYASALWMNDAVPDYGLIVKEEFDKYYNELIEKGKMIREALQQ